MKGQDYTVSIMVDATAQEAFDGINSVSKWWTKDLSGGSQRLNDEFTVRFGETFVTLKIVELIAGKELVWHVTDCNKPWLKDKKEWKDTKIKFKIAAKDNQTQISFTHLGLVPELECFAACSNAWNQYIQQSLWRLLTTGNGQADIKEDKIKVKSSTNK